MSSVRQLNQSLLQIVWVVVRLVVGRLVDDGDPESAFRRTVRDRSALKRLFVPYSGDILNDKKLLCLSVYGEFLM